MASVVVNAAHLFQARREAEASFKRGCYPQAIHDAYVRAYIDETFKIKREAKHA